MSKLIATCLLAVGILVGFAGAFAMQDMGEGDQEEQIAPLPTDDSFMNRMVGTWEWKGTSYPPNGEQAPFVATEKIEWVLNGQFLQSSYKMNVGGVMVYEGAGFTRKDPKSGDYKGWWFDALGDVSTGTSTVEGDTITGIGESAKGKDRHTCTFNADGTATALMERQWKGTDKYLKFMECTGKKTAE
ncbi:MAG: DUF1579 family protein [Planctomycetota bacterium]|nr:DUF1579 family protein [Planctomycetota bacterium]